MTWTRVGNGFRCGRWTVTSNGQAWIVLCDGMDVGGQYQTAALAKHAAEAAAKMAMELTEQQ